MKKKVLLLVMTLCFVKVCEAQMETQKAKFLYSIIRYIEWPDEINKSSFKIGVYGSFELYKNISDETLGRKFGDLNIEVINISRIEDLRLFKLHVLVLGGNNCVNDCYKKSISKTDGQPTLIVGEKESSVNTGACMAFYVNNNKLGFKLNKVNIQSRGLKISSHIDAFTAR